ncbi:MAG: DNA methyltransferase [Christensenellales bacterium]
MPYRVDTIREKQEGQGEVAEFYLADVLDILPPLLDQYAGQVQAIYIDPPFATGGSFVFRQRVGEEEHRKGVGSLTLPAYRDDLAPQAYEDMMRQVLSACHTLLADSGSMFVHIDYRSHILIRTILDEVFGADNLLNEIIWAYQTGGRAKRFFSRKHDTILFYRKGKAHFFDITQAPVPRSQERRNHMKRHIDADGRTYRSIKSGGKIYTYYDDDPAYPSDVWTDVSHLQQKDPQRTGYDTQKPYALLDRILRTTMKKGDLVMDLFVGSGTTMDAAYRLGRRFIGCDSSVCAYLATRKRMGEANAIYHVPQAEGAPEIRVRVAPGIAYRDVKLEAYRSDVEIEGMDDPMDAVDSWALGYVAGDTFETKAFFTRSKASPALKTVMKLPIYSGDAAIRVTDVFGRVFTWILTDADMEGV